MTEHTGLPVHGYQPQSEAKVALVNLFKQDEERLLRNLDEASNALWVSFVDGEATVFPAEQEGEGARVEFDPRWLAIARTGFEQAFMALNRAVFQPQRIALPEDVEAALEQRDLP